MKAHLKRLAMPKTWDVERKTTAFVIRPFPGGQPMHMGMPLQMILRDVLKFAKTSHEAKYILNNKQVLVNRVRRTEPKFAVMLMDTLELPDEGLSYRLLISRKGMLTLVPIPKKEGHLKPLSLLGKTVLGEKKVQLNFTDGSNMLVEKDMYRTGDLLLFDLDKKKVVEHVQLEKKALVYLVSGSRVGDVGTLQDIKGNEVIIKSAAGEVYETAKRYVFVVGKEKPLITLFEK
jgi:small subunit ribosomal protein S4e